MAHEGKPQTLPSGLTAAAVLPKAEVFAAGNLLPRMDDYLRALAANGAWRRICCPIRFSEKTPSQGQMRRIISAAVQESCSVEPAAASPLGQVSNSSNQPLVRLLRILAATLLGTLILLAWVGLPFELPYIGYGLVSAFVFQVAVRPRRWEILSVVLAAGGLVLFDRLVVHQGSMEGIQTSICFGMLGLMSFLVLGFKAVWATGPELVELKSILIPAAGFAFFILGSQNSLNLAGLLFPRTLDLYAYTFDGSLGFQPSFLLGQVFKGSALVDALGHLTYYGLPLAMALMYAGHLRRNATDSLSILRVYFAAGLVGYVLFLFFPATGPAYAAGPAFPNSPLSMSALHQLTLRPLTVSVSWPRNAMPSLHVAWVLLIWFNCRPFARWIRMLAFTFVLITVVDTLGTGEHYLIDLVVAFPFAVAMQALCARPARGQSKMFHIALVSGITLVVAWLILLRYATNLFLLTPVLPWVFVVTSTAISVWCTRFVVPVDEDRTPESTGLARAATASL